MSSHVHCNTTLNFMIKDLRVTVIMGKCLSSKEAQPHICLSKKTIFKHFVFYNSLKWFPNGVAEPLQTYLKFLLFIIEQWAKYSTLRKKGKRH